MLVALAWLVPYGFTFYGLIVAVSPLWAVLAQALVVPLLVGVAGTLWGGSAAAGRRIARLAGFSAGLGMFLYGTLAVAVIGAAGAQIDANWTVSANVDDRLGNNVIFYLWVLPLITAALGWAAAAATARIRPRLAVSVAAVPSTVSGQVGEGDPAPEIALPRAARRDRRTTDQAGAGPRISCCCSPSRWPLCSGWPLACSVANLPHAHRALLQHCLRRLLALANWASSPTMPWR